MLTKRMRAVFSRQIRCVCFLGGVKQPKANSLVIQFNLSFPTVVFAAYSGITRFVVAPFLILRVLGISGFSQVTQSVVGAIFVNVVKLICGPKTINMQPRQSMRGIQNIVHTNANVTVAHSAPSRIARSATASGFIPSKLACIGIVMDQFAKPSLGKLFSVHGLNNIKQAGNCQA